MISAKQIERRQKAQKPERTQKYVSFEHRIAPLQVPAKIILCVFGFHLISYILRYFGIMIEDHRELGTPLRQ